MKLKTWIGLAMALCLVGCSSDDQLSEPSPESKKGDFITVGENQANVFQYNYNADLDQGITFDLSQELGIPSNYLTLRQKDDQLSFYTFSNGAFSLATKNILTSAVKTFPNFYTTVQDRSVTWGINNETAAFFAYFGPSGSRNLGVLKVDLETSDELETTIDFNIERTYGPMLHGEILYISYKDNVGNYKLAEYDTATGAVGATLNFGTIPFAFFFNETGNLVVYKIGIEPSLEIYAAQGLTFLEKLQLDRILGFSAGPIENAFLIKDKIYFNIAYAQPSPLASGPAIYDLEAQDLTILDLFARVNEVEEEIDQPLFITVQAYHESENVFLIGYGTAANESLGGVFQVSVDDELLENVTFPFFPTYFVRK